MSPRASAAGALVDELDADLRKAAKPERAAHEKAYLKSPLRHYGTSVPAIRKAVMGVLASQSALSRRKLLALVRRLWSSPVHEHRMAAIELLEQRCDILEARDLGLVERMIRESFTWAYVDNLAASVAGPLIDRYPELAAELDRWAVAERFWLRRGALLALLLALRRGEGDWKRFESYADGMLHEEEFFIRKAIGWVLRDTSRRRPELVRRYVATRLDRMAPVTFREAVKHLSETDQRELRAAYRAAR